MTLQSYNRYPHPSFFCNLAISLIISISPIFSIKKTLPNTQRTKNFHYLCKLNDLKPNR